MNLYFSGRGKVDLVYIPHTPLYETLFNISIVFLILVGIIS